MKERINKDRDMMIAGLKWKFYDYRSLYKDVLGELGDFLRIRVLHIRNNLRINIRDKKIS